MGAYFACVKNLFYGNREIFRSSDLYVIGPKSQCTKYQPASLTDFKKGQEYGRFIEDFMVRHVLLMLAENRKTVQEALNSNRLPSAPRLSTSLTREPAKNYLANLEKMKSRALKKKERSQKASSSAASAASIMKRYRHDYEMDKESDIDDVTPIISNKQNEDVSGVCMSCNRLRAQNDVAYQELESLRLKLDRIQSEKARLQESVTDQQRDQEDAHNMIKVLSQDVKLIKDALKTKC